MMIGSYPCCNEPLFLPMPERTPAYQTENCPKCNKKVWHVFSKISPKSYLEKDFLEEYDIDYKTKIVTKREDKKEHWRRKNENMS